MAATWRLLSYSRGKVALLSRVRRLQVAALTGTVLRLCGGLSGDLLEADLDAGEGPALDAAVAEIHAIATDRVLLAEAAAMFTVAPATPARRDALRLLVAAGADEGEARAIQAARGGGWQAPQPGS